MLLRFDPFRELDRWADAPRERRGALPMDAVRRDGHVVVHLDLPGVDPESIDLTVERNMLTVHAERSFERTEGDEVITLERPSGVFERQLVLGDTLDPDRVEAEYAHGVLTLHIPVAETAKPRKVEVRSGSSPAELKAS